MIFALCILLLIVVYLVYKIWELEKDLNNLNFQFYRMKNYVKEIDRDKYKYYTYSRGSLERTQRPEVVRLDRSVLTSPTYFILI